MDDLESLLLALERNSMRGGTLDDIARAFTAHDEKQAEAWLRLSYRDRLRWLAGAKRFAKRAADAAAKRARDQGAEVKR